MTLKRTPDSNGRCEHAHASSMKGAAFMVRTLCLVLSMAIVSCLFMVAPRSGHVAGQEALLERTTDDADEAVPPMGAI
jgi:hypothetical protein